ncbi:hypothetical protein [Streptomyces dysideae]|uniref:Uncharacterized protein n=1 Tax=Streptomyces dysideae TaxID=909626 RepID=A0A117RY12_9ACTN|nr:hypothetical protein AQJ91_38445 [Streptomyces dysideae]
MHESFAHSVAQTSLIGGIIMAAGTMIVLAVLPGRRNAARHRPEGPAAEARDVEYSDSVQ